MQWDASWQLDEPECCVKPMPHNTLKSKLDYDQQKLLAELSSDLADTLSQLRFEDDLKDWPSNWYRHTPEPVRCLATPRFDKWTRDYYKVVKSLSEILWGADSQPPSTCPKQARDRADRWTQAMMQLLVEMTEKGVERANTYKEYPPCATASADNLLSTMM